MKLLSNHIEIVNAIMIQRLFTRPSNIASRTEKIIGPYERDCPSLRSTRKQDG
jgi:hypothetical protein